SARTSFARWRAAECAVWRGASVESAARCCPSGSPIPTVDRQPTTLRGGMKSLVKTLSVLVVLRSSAALGQEAEPLALQPGGVAESPRYLGEDAIRSAPAMELEKVRNQVRLRPKFYATGAAGRTSTGSSWAAGLAAERSGIVHSWKLSASGTRAEAFGPAG